MRIYQTVWEAVSYRGLFTADWFGVREKHCSPLEIYDRLRASEQADGLVAVGTERSDERCLALIFFF